MADSRYMSGLASTLLRLPGSGPSARPPAPSRKSHSADALMRDFPALQAAYARYGIATYPLRADKTPAVSGYRHIGAPYSAELAMKFPDATAAGFVAGRRTVLPSSTSTRPTTV